MFIKELDILETKIKCKNYFFSHLPGEKADLYLTRIRNCPYSRAFNRMPDSSIKLVLNQQENQRQSLRELFR